MFDRSFCTLSVDVSILPHIIRTGLWECHVKNTLHTLTIYSANGVDVEIDLRVAVQSDEPNVQHRGNNANVERCGSYAKRGWHEGVVPERVIRHSIEGVRTKPSVTMIGKLTYAPRKSNL